MAREWTISTRALIVLVTGILAIVVLAPVAVHAVTSSPVYLTNEAGDTVVGVSDSGELIVTANEKNPLPVRGVVGALPAVQQPQLLREVDVPGSAIVPVFTNVFSNDQQVAITSAIFANPSGANANVTVFGFGIGGASSCGSALPSPLGPSLVTVTIPAHGSVVVPFTQPALAPKRAFPANWCLGASQFNSPATADVLVTLEGYRL